MGTKVTIDEIENVENSSGVPTINDNANLLADEFDKVHYRDGSLSATDNWDMDSNRILNLPSPISSLEPVRLIDLEGISEPVFLAQLNSKVSLAALAAASGATLVGTDTGTLAARLTQIDVDVAAAEAAAEADKIDAQSAATAAIAAADQAASYVAAIDTSEIYPDQATGRAAVADGEYFYVVTDGVLGLYVRVDASNSTLVFTPAPASAVTLVPSTVGGTGNAITMSPKAGFSVISGGADQLFTGIATGQNSTTPTIAIPGVNGGAATTVKLPNGEPVPTFYFKGGYPFVVRYVSGLSAYILQSPIHTRPSSVLASQTAGTGNAITATISHPGVSFNSLFTDVIFQITVTAEKGVGGASLTLKDNSGTNLVTGAPLYDTDGASSPSLRAWLAGDTIEVRRHSTGYFYLVKRANATVATLLDAERGIDGFEYLTSPQRPVRATFLASGGMIAVDVRPPTTHYRDGYKRTQSDYTRIVLKNMKDLNSLTGNLYVLNSITGRMGNVQHNLSNFAFNETIGAITTNTGLVPSIFEPVLKIGEFGVTPAGSYALAGPGHGFIEAVSSSIIGTLNDVYTGHVDSTTDLSNAQDGVVFEGDKLELTQVVWYLVGTSRAVKVTFVHTIEPGSDYAIKISTTADFNDAGRAVTAGIRDGSYALMMPTRDVQSGIALQAGVAGSRVGGAFGTWTAGNVIDLGNSPGSIVSDYYGAADSFIGWNDNNPDIKLEGKMAFGVPYRINGVDTDYSVGTQAHSEDNDYGPKFYADIFLPTPADMTGNVLTFDNRYRIVRADGYV